MKNRIILAVTNDLSGDQRVHKVAMFLMKSGYHPILVGRMQAHSLPVKRPYDCKRFRLIFDKGALFYISYNIRLFLFLLVAKADIFLANDLDTLPAIFLAGKLLGKKIVYDSHEYFTEVPELVHRPVVKGIWESIEKLIFPKLRYVYTVNRSIANIYMAKYKIEVKVVRNLPSAVGSRLIEGKLPAGFTRRPIVLYQGAVNIGRGLEEMIRAVSLLPEVHLLVVGDGDIMKSMVDLVQNSGVSERVYFTGRLPFEEVSWYTSQATLGMSLEQDIGLNYHYALPNKLFGFR